MLSITRKADYALIAMADLAGQYPSVVCARDISNRLRIPAPILQKILTQLASGALLVSVLGPSGGYRLSRPPQQIALADVIAAIEGTFRLTACTGAEPSRASRKCASRPVCPVIGSMRKVHGLLEQCLTGVTLAQLASDTVPEIVTLEAATKRTRRKSAKPPAQSS